MHSYTVIVGVRKSALSPKWLLDCDIVQMDWNDPADLYRTCLDVDVVVHAAGMNAKTALLILLPLSILTVSQLDLRQLHRKLV